MLKYYDELYELLDGLFNEQLNEFETDERALAHLDEYLTRETDPDELGCLEFRYTAAAEHLLDNWYEEYYEESGAELIRCAKREVEIFRSHGLDRTARIIEAQLKQIDDMLKEGWD